MTAEASSAGAAKPNPFAGITGKWWFWALVIIVVASLIGIDVYEREDDDTYKPILSFLGEDLIAHIVLGIQCAQVLAGGDAEETVDLGDSDRERSVESSDRAPAIRA